MHEKVLPSGSRKILDRLENNTSPALQEWILAGGTGLALHLGHRCSEDFDFFRMQKMDLQGLHDVFKREGPYVTLQEEKQTLTVLIEGVKISFFQITDPFLFKTTPFGFFKVADIRDIALMKLIAISSRGSRKDFIDLFTILRSGMILRDYFGLLPKKYAEGRSNLYQILKSITFFEDAEEEPIPPMLEPFDWKECKAFFIREAHAIILPP